jgi:hypothetical protein
MLENGYAPPEVGQFHTIIFMELRSGKRTQVEANGGSTMILRSAIRKRKASMPPPPAPRASKRLKTIPSNVRRRLASDDGMILRSGQRKQAAPPVPKKKTTRKRKRSTSASRKKVAVKKVKVVVEVNDKDLDPEEWKEFHEFSISELQSRYYRHQLVNFARSAPLEMVDLIVDYVTDGFQPGDLADVFDKIGKWCIARVLEVNAQERTIKVHYIGWSAERFDEWVPADEKRIVPAFTHTASAQPRDDPSTGFALESRVVRLASEGFSTEEARKFLMAYHSLQDSVNALAFATFSPRIAV